MRSLHLRRLGVLVVAFLLLAAFSQSSAPAESGQMVPISVNSNYNMSVGSDVQSVSAGDSLSAGETWGFNVNNNGSSTLHGVQLSFGSADSGSDYTANGWNFDYKFFPTDPNAFVPNNPCPAATSTSESCPSPAVDLPPNTGEMTVFAATPESVMTTPGFDAARSVSTIPSSSDDAVSVAVTLQDSRYAGGTDLAVRGMQDNADPNATPTVTVGGQELPTCPQAAGVTCAYRSDFGAYQNGSATCESVSLQITNAQVGTQYVFGWDENEDTTSGCPTGEPGVTVLGFTPPPTSSSQPCDAGTDCSLTQSIAGLGDVTATVAAGQGFTGFNVGGGSIYLVNFAPANAPPPPSGTTSSGYGSSDSSTGTASATDNGTTASATGVGGITVSQWGSDPVTSPAFNASGNYFDVEVLSGSSFDTLTIQNCNLMNGDSFQWYDSSTQKWRDVSPAVFDHTVTPPCVTATLSDTSSPTIHQLGGTIFAVVNAPLLTVAKRYLTLAGTHVTARLRCVRLACRGTATLERAKAKTMARVLGRANYSIKAGKTATVRIVLTAVGKKALAHVSRTRHYAAKLSITVRHDAPVVAAVQVRK